VNTISFHSWHKFSILPLRFLSLNTPIHRPCQYSSLAEVTENSKKKNQLHKTYSKPQNKQNPKHPPFFLLLKGTDIHQTGILNTSSLTSLAISGSLLLVCSILAATRNYFPLFTGQKPAPGIRMLRQVT